MRDAAVTPLLLELKACLCQAAGKQNLCFCGLLVGEGIPVEYVNCDGGAAYVRLVQSFYSSRFPEPDGARIFGAAPKAYVVAAGIVRPSPMGDEEPPGQDVIEEHSRLLLSDMELIENAISCCMRGAYEDAQIAGMAYLPLPNGGGVDGGEWQFTVGSL